MPVDDAAAEILNELSEAKAWPERFKRKIDTGADVGSDIARADEKIDELENRAKKAIRRLGCVSPEGRSIYRAMADMLINWHTFKDTLP